MFIIQLAILIYSVILHEIAHGFIADRLGDPTARLSKRLTLNPLPHIDPLTTIALPLLLLLTGSPVIFGAAKPIPVDSFNLRDPKKDTAIIALSGPLTNLFLAIALSLLLRIVDIFILNDTLRLFLLETLSQGISLNILLAIFNFLPIPPLDGSKVLAGALPDNLASVIFQLERHGFLVIFFLLFFFPQLIYALVTPAARFLSLLLLP